MSSFGFNMFQFLANNISSEHFWQIKSSFQVQALTLPTRLNHHWTSTRHQQVSPCHRVNTKWMEKSIPKKRCMDENISYCTAIQTFSFNDGILYTQQHVLVNGVLLCGHRSCKQELFCLLWKKNTSVWKRTNIKCVLYYRWWCNMIWYTAKWYNVVYDTVYQYNIKINQHDIINIYVISYIYMSLVLILYYCPIIWNEEPSNESNLHVAPVGPLRSPHQAFSGAKCCNDKTPKTQRFLATSTWNQEDFLSYGGFIWQSTKTGDPLGRPRVGVPTENPRGSNRL